MSKYVEADKLIQSICNTADLGGWIGDTLLQIKKLAIKYIHSAPSIDICFCRECKYSGLEDSMLCCNHWHDEDGFCEVVKPDDFCSYGCREERSGE